MSNQRGSSFPPTPEQEEVRRQVEDLNATEIVVNAVSVAPVGARPRSPLREPIAVPFNDLRDISDGLFDAVLVLEPCGDDLCCRFANAAYGALLGFHPSEIEGRFISELLAPVHATTYRTHCSKALTTRATVETEDRFDIRDGRTLVNMRVRPIDNGDRLLVVCRDISDHKRSERALKRNNKRLSNVMESMDEAFLAVDRSLRISFLNPKAERLLSRTQREACTHMLWDVLPGLASTEIRDAFDLALSKQVVADIEIFYSPRDRWLRVHAYPSQDGISLYIQDVTPRKLAEEELRRSVGRLQSTLDGIVKAMALTVEMRDPYTAGHQRRVSVLATAIGEVMGLSADQLDDIRIAGLLHDIGKVSVPTEILNKPSRLSSAEFSIIQTHPQIGFNILKGIDFSPPIALVALQHHERLDGSGYPVGLTGSETILEARIMAVADVVEAMASHRPYRPALGIEKALEEVLRDRGVRYDAACVDACLEALNRNGFDFEQLMRSSNGSEQ